MTAEDKYGYWLDIAEYDLGAAGAMYDSGRWLYVLVMCQQAVEKLVKGLYTLYLNDDVPRTHNIKILLGRFEGMLPVSVPPEMHTFFDELSQYYLSNRYPEFISKLSLLVTESDAESTLSKAKEAFLWLLTLKP